MSTLTYRVTGTVLATLALTFGASGVMSASASAAAPTLAVSTTADVIEDATYQITLAGSGNQADRVTATIKAAGGQPCAANYAADDGTVVLGEYDSRGWLGTVGPFAVSLNRTTADAGDYRICAWVSGASGTARFELPLTVRTPKASVTAAAPATVAPGQTFQVTTVAQTEVTRALYLDVNNPGIPCGANYSANTGLSGVLTGTQNQGGPHQHVVNVTAPSAPGTYMLCGYVQEGRNDTVPEAAFASQFTVVAQSGAAVLTVARGPINVSRRTGRGALAVTCQNVPADRCTVQLRLQIRGKTVATVRGTVAGGQTKALAVRLTAKARRSLRRSTTVRVTGTSKNRARDSVGVNTTIKVRPK